MLVEAPTPDAGVETAARRIGPMGGWRVGPDTEHEVFARSEYREHAQSGDYASRVIIAPENLAHGGCTRGIDTRTPGPLLYGSAVYLIRASGAAWWL